MNLRTVRILIPRKRLKFPPRFAERKIIESIIGLRACSVSVSFQCNKGLIAFGISQLQKLAHSFRIPLDPFLSLGLAQAD